MARSTTTAPARRSAAAWKAVAAAGVGVLLLGAGGATFAEWSDAELRAEDTAITSGVLDLAAGEGSWTNVAGQDVTAAVSGGSYLIVPGDALTYRETLRIEARGELLAATVGHNLRELAGDGELIAQLDTGTTMSLNGQVVEGSVATVEATEEAQTVDVAVTVGFDAATEDLFAQGASVSLGGLDVTLTQAPITAAN